MRQSGRTTRILQDAHRAKEFERVLIVCPNSSVREQVVRMAASLGLMDGGHRPLTRHDFTTTHHVMQGKLRGYSGRVFQDHTVQEFGPPLAFEREMDMWANLRAPKKPEPAEPRWKFVPF